MSRMKRFMDFVFCLICTVQTEKLTLIWLYFVKNPEVVY